MPSSPYQALLQSGKGLSALESQEPKFGSVFSVFSSGFDEVQSVDIDFSGGYPDLIITRTNSRTFMDGSVKGHGGDFGFPPEESWYWNDRLIREDHFHLPVGSGEGDLIVEYDGNDPTDYTAWGYWSHSARNPYDSLSLEVGGIAAGRDFEDTAGYVSDLIGTATYQGDYLGKVLYAFSDYTGIDEAEYFASVDLTANFDSDTIAGCIGCRQAKLYNIVQYRVGVGQLGPPEDRETDLRIQLGSAPISSDGKFLSSSVTVQGPGLTSGGGDWAGRFTSIEDVRPQDLIGTVKALYTDASGVGLIFGGFYATDSTE